MTEKERLIKALSGGKVDRKPVICPGGMMTMVSREVMARTGCVWPDAHRDAGKMATLSMAMHDEAGFENLGIPFCMTVEAEAWGGEVEDGDEVTEPCIVAYPMQTVSDWRKLRKLDPSKDGRLPTILSCTRMLQGKRADTPVIGNLVGALSLASSLIDAVTLYKELLLDPAEVRGMLDFLTENCIAYGEALIDNGADVIAIADPSATGEILGPRLFKEFVLPYLNRMIAAMHARGILVIVHICGDIRPVYKPLAMLDADCLSVDSVVSMRDARKALPAKKLMGNVSTGILQKGPSPLIEKLSKDLLNTVDILAPACGISAKTPVVHLRAMTETAKRS